MIKLYTITGLKREGDDVRLVLMDNGVTEKNGLLSGLSNLQRLQEQMTFSTQKIQNPDQIRIPYDEWKRHMYNIEDIITIEIKSEVD